MSITHTDPEEEAALWAELQRRLEYLDWEPLPTPELIQAELQRLPPRRRDEPLAAWLRRCYPRVPRHTGPKAQVIPLRPRPRGRLRPIAEALAWAAAEQGSGPLALPERLEVGKDAFEVHFSPRDDGRIQVGIQALGWTMAELQGQEIAVTGPGGLEQLLALVRLDPLGAAAFEVADSDEVRRLLLNLRIGRIEES